MIFVCHFANNKAVINKILKNAKKTLEKYTPFMFEKNNQLFNEIGIKIDELLPKTVGSNSDVPRHREEELKRLDEAGIVDGSLKEGPDTFDDESAEIENDLMEISSSIKTLEVLGQILQNYPADIAGDDKVMIIDEIHKLGMRTVQAIVQATGYVEEDLVKAVLERAIQEKTHYSRDKIVLETRRNITILISNMARGMLSMVAGSLNSSFLLTAATKALSQNGVVSSKLVLQELKLNYLKTAYYGDIEELYIEFDRSNNLFAKYVLSTIVANYLRYNKCDYRLRNRLCSLFGFSEQKTFKANQKILSIEGKQ